MYRLDQETCIKQGLPFVLLTKMSQPLRYFCMATHQASKIHLTHYLAKQINISLGGGYINICHSVGYIINSVFWQHSRFTKHATPGNQNFELETVPFILKWSQLCCLHLWCALWVRYRRAHIYIYMYIFIYVSDIIFMNSVQLWDNTWLCRFYRYIHASAYEVHRCYLPMTIYHKLETFFSYHRIEHNVQ